jgi:hypothetical protein
MFSQKYKEKQFFCGHHILREGNFIMTNCVGYNKLLFHEQNAAYLIECVL